MITGCKGVGKRNGVRLFFKIGGAFTCIVCLLLSGSPVVAAGSTNWTVDGPIKDSTYSTYKSMALDGNGNPAVAFEDWKVSPSIVFAYRQANGTWATETVDSNGAGNAIAMTWDGSTWVLVYGDRSLMFAKRTGVNSWSKQTIDNSGPGGGYSRGIAAYRDGSTYKIGVSFDKSGLYYAEYDGKTWTKIGVDKNAGGHYNAVHFDSNGNPVIAYSDSVKSSCDTLKFAKRTSGKWSITTVASGVKGISIMVGLDLDSSNNPFIVSSYGGAHLFSPKTGGGWDKDDQLNTAAAAAIVVDDTAGTATPYVSYYDTGLHGVSAAKKSGNNWTVETVDTALRTNFNIIMQHHYSKDASGQITDKKLGIGYAGDYDDQAKGYGMCYAERNLLNPSTWG